MKPLKVILLIVSISMLFSLQSSAQQRTTVVVRAKAKDAKFIGDALITIIDTETEDILAKGLTEGDTGDTKRLINNPITRYEKISTPGAAQFRTNLSLQKPTLVTIKATANYEKRYARITVSTQKWLIPGKDITGDGIILEIPGFVIDNQLPEVNKLYRAGKGILIRSHIAMMCGCTTSNGGLWDSSEYEIKAQISRNDHIIREIPLSFSGKASLFEAFFVPSSQGNYQILVYAYHAKTGNTGLDETNITVEQ